MVGMVYCTKCGAENEDDAVTCKECGASLRQPTYRRYRRQFEDDICFGTRDGVPIWAILFGILIVLWGVSSLLGSVYRWAVWGRIWPLFIIAFGLLILINALTRQ